MSSRAVVVDPPNSIDHVPVFPVFEIFSPLCLTFFLAMPPNSGAVGGGMLIVSQRAGDEYMEPKKAEDEENTECRSTEGGQHALSFDHHVTIRVLLSESNVHRSYAGTLQAQAQSTASAHSSILPLMKSYGGIGFKRPNNSGARAVRTAIEPGGCE